MSTARLIYDHILLEISDFFHLSFYSDRHILHYGNDTVYPYWEEEICHFLFLSTINDQKNPLAKAGIVFLDFSDGRRVCLHFTVLASLQINTAPPSTAQGRRTDAPDSLWAGLADPPEDWQAARPYDAPS